MTRDRKPESNTGPTEASEELISFGTKIPEPLAREVRAAAALEGRSVQEWVAVALRKALEEA